MEEEKTINGVTLSRIYNYLNKHYKGKFFGIPISIFEIDGKLNHVFGRVHHLSEKHKGILIINIPISGPSDPEKLLQNNLEKHTEIL